MRIIVDRKTPESEVKNAIKAMLKQGMKKKKLDTSLFSGKLNWGEDALTYQQRLRDEWN